jgi:hypothetical protein
LSVDVPYETFYPGCVRPYTRVTAASAGWVRDVPLLGRRVLSFAYCSDFLDDEDAERELRVAEGPHSDSLWQRVAPVPDGAPKKCLGSKLHINRRCE